MVTLWLFYSRHTSRSPSGDCCRQIQLRAMNGHYSGPLDSFSVSMRTCKYVATLVWVKFNIYNYSQPSAALLPPDWLAYYGVIISDIMRIISNPWGVAATRGPRAGSFFEQNCKNSSPKKLKNSKTQAKICSKTQGTGTFIK